MKLREHQSDMFWMGVSFTLLHLISPARWPFYALTGIMFFLWMTFVVIDWRIRRLDAEIARLQSGGEVK